MGIFGGNSVERACGQLGSSFTEDVTLPGTLSSCRRRGGCFRWWYVLRSTQDMGRQGLMGSESRAEMISVGTQVHSPTLL